MKKIFFIAMFLFILMATPFVTSASVFFFMPQSMEYQESDTFIRSLYLDTNGQEVNAIESRINFNQDVLEVVDIITGDSVVKFWVETPTISNEKGVIEFVGGTPNGYNGKGVILKIIFKAKKVGDCDLNISDTKLLLNNSEAAEDETIFSNDNCNIIERSEDSIKITCNSHSDQDEWQSSNTIDLHWDLIDKAEYSYILSKDFMAEPDGISDKPKGKLIWMGDMSYEGLEDDIYYFHLKQKLSDEEDWSSKATVRAMIDATIPEEFMSQTVEIEGRRYLVFSATDVTSGVDHYEMSEVDLNWFGNVRSEEEAEWRIIESPYLLDDQNLKKIIKIKAIDKAGNERLSEIVLSSNSKYSTSQIAFFILVMMAITVLILWKLLFFKRK